MQHDHVPTTPPQAHALHVELDFYGHGVNCLSHHEKALWPLAHKIACLLRKHPEIQKELLMLKIAHPSHNASTNVEVVNTIGINPKRHLCQSCHCLVENSNLLLHALLDQHVITGTTRHYWTDTKLRRTLPPTNSHTCRETRHRSQPACRGNRPQNQQGRHAKTKKTKKHSQPHNEES